MALAATAALLPYVALAEEEPVDVDADWVFIASDSTGGQFYMAGKARAPKIQSDGTVVGWVKGDYIHDKTKSIRSSMSKYSIKCKAESMARVAIFEYNADGSVYYSKVNAWASYDPIIPETIGEQIYNKLCFSALVNKVIAGGKVDDIQ